MNGIHLKDDSGFEYLIYVRTCNLEIFISFSYIFTANIKADLSGTGELTTDKKGRSIAQIKTVNVKLRIGDATGTATNIDNDRNNERISKYYIARDNHSSILKIKHFLDTRSILWF